MGFFDARFGAYLVVAALLIMTPGPDTALVTRNALLAGKRAASFTTLGIGAGSIIWALASVLGIAALLEKSVVAFTVFKFVGAAYLGYLGLRSLFASFRGDRQAPMMTTAPQTTQLGKQVAFRQGLLNNLLNPKAGAIFATALPQFISPGDPALRLAQPLWLSGQPGKAVLAPASVHFCKESQASCYSLLACGWHSSTSDPV